LNHRKKTKTDGSRLIPRKHTETLVLLSVRQHVALVTPLVRSRAPFPKLVEFK